MHHGSFDLQSRLRFSSFPCSWAKDFRLTFLKERGGGFCEVTPGFFRGVVHSSGRDDRDRVAPLGGKTEECLVGRDREGDPPSSGKIGNLIRAATRAIEGYGRKSPGSWRAAPPTPPTRRTCTRCSPRGPVLCGLPGFAWRCTLRGWAYTLARHAELRCGLGGLPPEPAGHGRRSRGARRHPHDHRPVRSDRREGRFRAIARGWPRRIRQILVLRVDRDLGWRDIAQVLAGPGAPVVADDPQRAEARIRKRFQIIKERLRHWAADDGLLPARELPSATSVRRNAHVWLGLLRDGFGRR